jgi:hypothetical protein
MLAAAFAQNNNANLRLGAFYLGNWLTDVSQAVDPVAIATLRVGFRDAMYAIILEVERWSSSFPDFTQLTINQIRNGLIEERRSIDEAVSVLAGSGTTSPLADAVRSALFVLGYRHFVHPANPAQPARMDYAAFKSIVRGRFTQYFPHEHVDRYPGNPTLRGGYSGLVAAGTNTPTGTGTGAAALSPHQYKYLVDDIKITAGLLADIDLHWARLHLGPLRNIRDTDAEWNTFLAKLGHAVHSVEDYFVHSNFVELALSSWTAGDTYLPAPPSTFSLHVADSSHEIVQRRLRRFDGPDLPNSHPETNVVTGYFDFADTVFSLRHVWEGLFEPNPEGPNPDPAGPWRALLHATIVDVHERSRLLPSLSRAQAIQLAQQSLVDQASHGDSDVRTAANEVLNVVPADVRQEFLNAVAQFSVRAPGSAISLYTAFERIHVLEVELRQPLRWIRRVLALPANAVTDWMTRQTEMRLRQIIDKRIGRTRIGCHSLLAKDYAWNEVDREPLDVIYNLAKNLAKAVHWYIIHSLTRWAHPNPIPVPRNFVETATSHSTIDAHHYIDWLELLECFLRHPHSVPAPVGTPWWQEVIAHGHARMAELFTQTSAGPRPHQHVFITEAEVQSLIDDASALRRDRENFYNSDPVVAEARASGQ